MTIYDRLPTYHQIEANNLKGLQPGFVVAQMDIAETAKTALLKDGMFENGHICAITKDGTIKATGQEKDIFINYTEPLNTIYNGAKFFAVDVSKECGRLVQLIPGDEWMSDMAPEAVCIEGRIIELKPSDKQSSDDWYSVTTMPDGTAGHHYMFLG